MDIKNVGEFAQYCQQHADDESLPEAVALAGKWTDLSMQLKGQYGGRGESMDEWINEAYARMTAEGLTVTQDQLVKTHDIVTNFWRHGEAFDKWFQSKVLIVQS